MRAWLLLLALLPTRVSAQDPSVEDDDGEADEGGDGVLSWRRDDAEWRSPTLIEREGVRAIARDLVAGREACTARGLRRAEKRALELGMELAQLEIEGRTLVVLREGEEAFGAGLLAVRCGPAEPIVWQAPHPFFDYRTGQLVRQWFLESDARAAQWATHHRFRALQGELREDSVHPADVADEPGSLFQAATLGLYAGDPQLRFVQLHGFAQESAPGWSAVVSSGDSRFPLEAVGARLDRLIGTIAVFGRVDLPLGGQQNAQGRALPVGSFLHLELSPSARKRLIQDEEARRRVSRAIGDGPW